MATFKNAIGVALDIDGVLLLEDTVIRVTTLPRCNFARTQCTARFYDKRWRDARTSKASQLQKLLGVPVSPQQVLLSHTPFQSLVPQYKDKPVMVLGFKEELDVARAYGFKNVVSAHSYVRANPSMYPFPYSPDVSKLSQDESCPPVVSPIEAILIFHDPVQWRVELQVCLDVLREDRSCVSRMRHR